MRNKIPSLNGLRAVSIAIVVFAHLKLHCFLPNKGWVKYANMMLLDGRFAVNIFFFISGYLITTLLEQELSNTGTISLKNFYLRRTLRIFPAYYFLLFVYAILQLTGFFTISRLSWILSVFYLKQFDLGQIEVWHLWSLSVEEFFYLIWPFLFIKFYRYKTWVSVILIVCAVIVRVLFYSYPSPGLQRTIFTGADALLIGCLYAIYNEQIKRAVLKRYFSVIVLIFILVGCISIDRYCYHTMTVQSMNGGYNKTIFVISAFVYGLFGNVGVITNILVGLFVIRSVYYRGGWFKLLNSRIMDYIGALSYSIYLWHQLFISERPFWHQFSIPVLLIFILVAALISYYGVERPFLLLKKKFAVNKSEGKLQKAES